MSCRVSARMAPMPNHSDKVDPFWIETRKCLQAAVQRHTDCLQTSDAENLAAHALEACRNDPKAALAILVAVMKIQRAIEALKERTERTQATAHTASEAAVHNANDSLVPTSSFPHCDSENSKPEASHTTAPADDPPKPVHNALKRNAPTGSSSIVRDNLSEHPAQPSPKPHLHASSSHPTGTAAVLPLCFQTAPAEVPDAIEGVSSGGDDASEAQLTNVYPSWDYAAYLDNKQADMDVDVQTDDLLCLGYDHPGQFNTVDCEQVVQA